MKYITEEDLRDLYRKAPFADFRLEQGARLTPGARQFLMDKGINMFDTDACVKGTDSNSKPSSATPEKKADCKMMKLYGRMKSIEAMFLLTEEELLGRDVCLAQSVIALSKQFSCIKKTVKHKAPVDNLCCNECTGINQNNFSDELDDCFEINEFHVQLEKGREILVLHRLRCELNELKPVILELYEGSDENGQCEELTGKVNQIVNSLSQLICLTFGGKKCQRQY